MANVIKLRKGLDINLTGRAQEQMLPVKSSTEYALVPDDFPGLTPKVTVREGDHVRAGDPLFVDKGCTEVSFASPVSGTVTAVERGERRKVLRVKIAADAQQEYADFGVKDVAAYPLMMSRLHCCRRDCLVISTSCLMLLLHVQTQNQRQFSCLHFVINLCRVTSSLS